ncbi:unnamed protein product, partial [Callosobruchus maculatus]
MELHLDENSTEVVKNQKQSIFQLRYYTGDENENSSEAVKNQRQGQYSSYVIMYYLFYFIIQSL